MSEKRFPFIVRTPESIQSVFDFCWQALRKTIPGVHFSNQAQSDLRLAFYEAVANAIRHADELKKYGQVSGELFLSERSLGFRVIDHGEGFELSQIRAPDLEDFSSSGRGLFMIKQVADSLQYRKSSSRNVLTFKRHLLGQNSTLSEVDVFYDISEAVVRGLPVDEVFRLILNQAVKVFPVERASILLFDEKVKRLKVVASHGLSGDLKNRVQVRAGEGVSGFVFQHGRALLIEDIETNQRGLTKRGGYKSHSFVSVPLIRSPLHESEKTVGVINLTDRTDGKKFTRRDLKILSTLANQAMLCLHMRDLLDASEKSQSMQREFEIIRRIQMSYLPEQPPQFEGYELAGRCDMATTLGGDYYDFVQTQDALYVVIADVSGHDARSAMTMLGFRAQFRLLARDNVAPDLMLKKINSILFDDLVLQGQFVSAFVLKIFNRSGEFESSCAGHYPPQFFSDKIFSSDSGLLIGIERNADFPMVTGRLSKNDGLVLFTDGIIESMNNKREMFGLKKLSEILKRYQNASVEDLVNHLIESARVHRAKSSPQDDMAAVVIKRL